MKLRFSKMQGAGNDFIVIDATCTPINLPVATWRRLADRRFGIGADQILLVEASQQAGVDFRYRIVNADGGEVEQCGNGARAFVKFALEKGLTQKTSIRVETKAGIIEPRMEADGQITVNMGVPAYAPDQVAFNAQGLTPQRHVDDLVWPLTLESHESSQPQHPAPVVTAELSLVSMGNPHAVQIVADIDEAPVALQGPLIERHARFLNRVNAGFMQVIDRHTIKLRVFERGAGETLSCGTGACAAVVAGIRRGLLDSPVRVETRGGLLMIRWDSQGQDQPVFLTGPALTVFEGEIEI